MTLYIGVTGAARGLDRGPDFQLAAGPNQLGDSSRFVIAMS